SARSSSFLFRCSRWNRASSVSRHRLVVTAIPTAAQAITALPRQCKAIHEIPRVREIIIWNHADWSGSNRVPCPVCSTKITRVPHRQRCEGRVWENVFVTLETIGTNSSTMNRQFFYGRFRVVRQERKSSTSSNFSKRGRRYCISRERLGRVRSRREAHVSRSLSREMDTVRRAERERSTHHLPRRPTLVTTCPLLLLRARLG